MCGYQCHKTDTLETGQWLVNIGKFIKVFELLNIKFMLFTNVSFSFIEMIYPR